MSIQHLTSVEPRELKLLRGAANALDIDETAGEALFLIVSDGVRCWVAENSRGQLFVTVTDRELRRNSEEQFALSSRVRYFAECFDEHPLVLGLADDATVVAQAGPATAAIDLVDAPAAMRQRLEFEPTAEAVVTLRQFMGLLWSARCMPSGIDDIDYPMPPMWLGIGDGTAGLHVDWRDFTASRATYRLNWRRGYGSSTVSIPHKTIEDFLQHAPIDHDVTSDLDHDIELTIEVGHNDTGFRSRPAIRFSAADWSLVLFLDDPLTDRWASKIEAEFERADIKVLDQQANEWMVGSLGTSVRVKLHAGHPDVARVSATLLDGVDESIELLRELSQLNAASTGVRHWFEDGTIRVATDVACNNLSALAASVNDVARAVTTYAPMLAAFS
ncbi:MAG: hypothetical protein RLZ14_385 [Actinomycetota bacterium]